MQRRALNDLYKGWHSNSAALQAVTVVKILTNNFLSQFLIFMIVVISLKIYSSEYIHYLLECHPLLIYAHNYVHYIASLEFTVHELYH